METLFAIGMMVGLIKGYAEPAKSPAPGAQIQHETRQAEKHQPNNRQEPPKSAEAEKQRPRSKSEWLLSY